MIQLDTILPTVSKPGRYAGGEWNSVTKDWAQAEVRFALAYPDLYDIGMSSLGVLILYDLLNRQPHVLCERVFAPWVDMEAALRHHCIPLFSLESRHPVGDFDILGFSLGHELTYTNVLNMLDLAKIPLLSRQRTQAHPLIIAGGACTVNPEPMADFVDVFVIGEGEEVLLELVDAYRRWKGSGGHREELLRHLVTIPGVYVPSFYRVEYRPNGTVAAVSPTVPEAPGCVKRRFVEVLPPPVTKPIVPYIQTVHDRAVIELQRGCTRGCRFCQAGTIYRPMRLRSHEEVLATADDLLRNTGYNELSLLSLSSSDYPGIEELVEALALRYRDKGLAISLPSLRADSFSVKLADSLEGQGKKRQTFTFAPEGGSERLRRAINKGYSNETLLEAMETAFRHGWGSIKLYFMIGLPTETEGDVLDIAELANQAAKMGKRHAGSRTQIKVSVATYIPKAHTPFQWVPQECPESLLAKLELLKHSLKRPAVKLSWHDLKQSVIESLLSRGDRRVGQAILRAWELGCTFDAWTERFRYEKWHQAMAETGIDLDCHVYRQRSLDEAFPWAHIDSGVSHAFLRREYQRTVTGSKETLDCRYGPCTSCGFQNAYPDCQKKFSLLLLSKSGAVIG